jgi:hypothetical protein
MNTSSFSQSIVSSQSEDCVMDLFLEEEEEGIDISLLQMQFLQPVFSDFHNEDDHLLKESDNKEENSMIEYSHEPKSICHDEISPSLTLETQKSDDAIEVMCHEDEGQEIVYNPEDKNRKTINHPLRCKCLLVISIILILLAVLGGCLWGIKFRETYSGTEGKRNSTDKVNGSNDTASMEIKSKSPTQSDNHVESLTPSKNDYSTHSPSSSPSHLRAPASNKNPTSVQIISESDRPPNSKRKDHLSLSPPYQFLKKLRNTILNT